MENYFYHIRWPLLNVTNFIRHLRRLRNGNSPMGEILLPDQIDRKAGRMKMIELLIDFQSILLIFQDNVYKRKTQLKY